jgi:hypothetical protein
MFNSESRYNRVRNLNREIDRIKSDLSPDKSGQDDNGAVYGMTEPNSRDHA